MDFFFFYFFFFYFDVLKTTSPDLSAAVSKVSRMVQKRYKGYTLIRQKPASRLVFPSTVADWIKVLPPSFFTMDFRGPSPTSSFVSPPNSTSKIRYPSLPVPTYTLCFCRPAAMGVETSDGTFVRDRNSCPYLNTPWRLTRCPT